MDFTYIYLHPPIYLNLDTYSHILRYLQNMPRNVEGKNPRLSTGTNESRHENFKCYFNDFLSQEWSRAL